MIIEMFCSPLFELIKFFISLLPVLTYIPNSIVSTIDLLLKAMSFFPADVWFITIGNILFWIGLHLAWGVINFVLKLIPFIGIGD